MKKTVNALCRKFKNHHRINHIAMMLICVLVLVVMVCRQLRYTVLTMTKEDTCGYEEYTHAGATLGYADMVYTGEEEIVQPETVSFTAKDCDVTVQVIAPEGALPDDAVLSVALIDEDSEDYAAAAEAIGYEEDAGVVVASASDASEIGNEDEETASSLAVLDITFTVDGVEVEPSCAVTVIIDASSLMTEDADASTLEVQHLEESSEGIMPVLVADATEATAGNVDTESAVAEFKVDSFSTFTLTWKYSFLGILSNDQNITVNVYDTDGNSIDYTSISNSFSSGTAVTLANICTVNGYEYQSATITYTSGGSSTTTDLTTITCSYSIRGWSYAVDGSTLSGSSISITSINLYFKKTTTTASLTIHKYEKDKTIELSGATFTLESSDADLSAVTASSVAFDSQTTDSITFTTTDTAITFDNLPEGTYTLTETSAPTGYNIADAVSFAVSNGEVTYDGANGLATISGLRLSDTTNTFAYVLNESTAPEGYVRSTDVKVITVSIDSSNYNTGVYSVEIENSKTTSGLPETGGLGVDFYIISGLFLIACTVLLSCRYFNLLIKPAK